MDHSSEPPVKLALNSYDIFKQEVVETGVQSPSYKGYTRIYPSNVIEDPNDKFKLLGKVTEYRLLLPYQIVRFYPASKPELYVENTILLVLLTEIIDEVFTPEEIRGFFQEGKFKKSYGFGDITQELEIGYPPLGRDQQVTSLAGAIVLSGDCIDHGGYVIASDTSTTVNGKPVARIGDKVLCYKHGNSA
ncbi:PAAR domain-containing protein, partial [bacterium]|nr:PAAR domain-containing protein [bacterium]